MEQLLQKLLLLLKQLPVAAPTPAAAPTATPAPAPTGSEGSAKVTSPMPGNILDIKVNVGDRVEANQCVVVLEAMKMENEIVTPSAGTVASVNVTKVKQLLLEMSSLLLPNNFRRRKKYGTII